MKATTPPTTSFKINIPLVVTHDDLSSLICSAVEGGGIGWKIIQDPPEELIKAKLDGDLDSNTEWGNYPEYCVGHPAWALRLVDYYSVDAPRNVEEWKRGEGAAFHTLRLEDLKKGFKLFATKGGRHFTDWQNENTDAITADIFLQYCVFGEVKYP